MPSHHVRDPLPSAKSESRLHRRRKHAFFNSLHGLWNAIGHILDLYSPQECTNYFANAGYDAD
ncbi:hypothetical protein ACUXAX_003517 [Sphingomonas sanguinis]